MRALGLALFVSLSLVTAPALADDAGGACSADGRSLLHDGGAPTGCGDYVCHNGIGCLTACLDDKDCIAPATCSNAHTCWLVTTKPEDEGDACAYGGRGSTTFGLALVGLSLMARARRKIR